MVALFPVLLHGCLFFGLLVGARPTPLRQDFTQNKDAVKTLLAQVHFCQGQFKCDPPVELQRLPKDLHVFTTAPLQVVADEIQNRRDLQWSWPEKSRIKDTQRRNLWAVQTTAHEIKVRIVNKKQVEAVTNGENTGNSDAGQPWHFAVAPVPHQSPATPEGTLQDAEDAVLKLSFCKEPVHCGKPTLRTQEGKPVIVMVTTVATAEIKKAMQSQPNIIKDIKGVRVVVGPRRHPGVQAMVLGHMVKVTGISGRQTTHAGTHDVSSGSEPESSDGEGEHGHIHDGKTYATAPKLAALSNAAAAEQPAPPLDPLHVMLAHAPPVPTVPPPDTKHLSVLANAALGNHGS